VLSFTFILTVTFVGAGALLAAILLVVLWPRPDGQRPHERQNLDRDGLPPALRDRLEGMHHRPTPRPQADGHNGEGFTP